MRNLKLTLQYDGTDYSGWQIQAAEVRQQTPEAGGKKNIITIQGTLQQAIKKLTGEDAKVIGAGRTDAGVHAFGQVASFKTTSELPADTIRNALNANLPEDIRVINSCDEDIRFHPRYDAGDKTYFYIISNTRIVSPFLHRYSWRLPYKLNLDEMSRALSLLKGTLDFSAFRGSGCSSKNPVRTIFEITVEKLDTLDFMTARLEGSFIKTSIRADAFLRHMARNIVGTAVEAARGRIKAEDLKKIIDSKDRKLAGPNAPAKGLFLEKITY